MNKIKENLDKCEFCDKSQPHSQIINQLLSNKFFYCFNFFLAKPVNQIVHCCRLSHVILFKDSQIYDDSETYFKRFYQRKEVSFQNLMHISKSFRPSLISFYELKPIRSLFKQNIEKNNKKSRLKEEKSSRNSDFLERFSSEINEQSQKKGQNDISDDLRLDFAHEIKEENPLGYIKKTRIKLADERLNLNQSGSFLKDLEKHLEELSFETVEFNIYDPNYSSGSSFCQDSVDINEIRARKQEKLKAIDIQEMKFELGFEELCKEEESGPQMNKYDLKRNSFETEDFKKKYSLKVISQTKEERQIPSFLIKKGANMNGAKPKDNNNNKNEEKNQQHQAGLKRNNPNPEQTHYKSLTTPFYSSSFSNMNLSKGIQERNEDGGELEENKKKMGLKEKIMEMNRIYTKKPNFSHNLALFKEK